MALDVAALALSKKYTADSLEGAGALKGQDGKDGADGKSAYEVAVEQGYSGTEAEWLESLKGADGATGEAGATFTPSVDEDGDLSWTNDFGLDNPATVNIKGATGEQGEQGATGADGFSPTITENSENTDTSYKLDITDKNGTFTTPNLIGDVGEENVIETVKVNDTALTPDDNKAVNIDLTGYVEKEDGYSLVSDSDITQITTNKDDIATLNGAGDGSVDKKIATALSELTYLSKKIIDEETAAAYISDPTQAEFNVIYLVKDDSASGSDVYKEYQRLGDDTSSVFELTGDTSTDLSDYYTKTETDTALADKVDVETGKVLSANDFTDAYKTKLDGIESGAEVNTVTGVKGEAETSYRNGNVNITPENIGLGNVDNTADSEKTVLSAGKLGTSTIGAEDTPIYLVNGSPAECAQMVLVYNNAGAHNSIYRGKYLGDSVTDEQYETIAVGTFKDLYIGDYWTIDGVNWRIAAFDYYYNTGSTACTSHHAVIVPDSVLYDESMNNSDTTSTGYAGSTMYSSGLEKAKTIIATSFDESSILYKYVLLTTAATDGVPSKTGWYRSTVEIMTEQMVYGCPIRQQMSATGTSILNRYIEKTQLPLFALRPDMITNRSDWWLRDIASDTDYCAVSELGFSDTCAAGDSYGVRPAFCIF